MSMDEITGLSYIEYSVYNEGKLLVTRPATNDHARQWYTELLTAWMNWVADDSILLIQCDNEGNGYLKFKRDKSFTKENRFDKMEQACVDYFGKDPNSHQIIIQTVQEDRLLLVENSEMKSLFAVDDLRSVPVEDLYPKVQMNGFSVLSGRRASDGIFSYIDPGQLKKYKSLFEVWFQCRNFHHYILELVDGNLGYLVKFRFRDYPRSKEVKGKSITSLKLDISLLLDSVSLNDFGVVRVLDSTDKEVFSVKAVIRGGGISLFQC